MSVTLELSIYISGFRKSPAPRISTSTQASLAKPAIAVISVFTGTATPVMSEHWVISSVAGVDTRVGSLFEASRFIHQLVDSNQTDIFAASEY